MLSHAKTLIGYTLHALDGDIGSAGDFYFDDDAWTVRYLVADTGTWLTGRKVLVSPFSFGGVDSGGKKINIKLTKKQIENGPDIDTQKPISRQHELQFYNYYGYPYYWGGPFLWGPAAFPMGLEPRVPATETAEIQAANERDNEQNQHLRSVSEVVNYNIEAEDGAIGHVEDFLLDDKNWMIRFIVVDTKNWWPGKKVLVAPEWIKNVSWKDSAVYVELTREAIKTSPEYDPAEPHREDYARRLREHYQKALPRLRTRRFPDA